MVQNTQPQKARDPRVARLEKQRTDAAIAAALARDWNTAVQQNEEILGDDPDNLEAANRLGKALTELGKTEDAIAAYGRALEIDPSNSIAKKNIQRLEEAASNASTAAPAARRKKGSGRATGAAATTSLIESSDRAAEFVIQRPNDEALESISSGDTAQIEPHTRGIAVKSDDGELLGFLEPRAGLRLKRMIEGGNRYEVIVRSAHSDRGTIVLIRETHRDPSLVGQASFLASDAQRRRVVRAYTKDSVRNDRDNDFISDEESEESPADSWNPRDDDDESDEDDVATDDATDDDDDGDSDDEAAAVGADDEVEDDDEEEYDGEEEFGAEFADDRDEDEDEDRDEDEDDE
jgi:hypothetical protein